MLHELLRVKKIREGSAHRVVQQCKKNLQLAEEKAVRKQEELVEYVEWRCKEEQKLYDNIINAQVKQKELDGLKSKIAVLREKDLLLQQAIGEAEKKVKDAQSELAKAREAHQLTMKAVEKFEAFTEELDEEAAKEADRLEDLDLEEFITRPKF